VNFFHIFIFVLYDKAYQYYALFSAILKQVEYHLIISRDYEMFGMFL